MVEDVMDVEVAAAWDALQNTQHERSVALGEAIACGGDPHLAWGAGGPLVWGVDTHPDFTVSFHVDSDPDRYYDPRLPGPVLETINAGRIATVALSELSPNRWTSRWAITIVDGAIIISAQFAAPLSPGGPVVAMAPAVINPPRVLIEALAAGWPTRIICASRLNRGISARSGAVIVTVPSLESNRPMWTALLVNHANRLA